LARNDDDLALGRPHDLVEQRQLAVTADEVHDGLLPRSRPEQPDLASVFGAAAGIPVAGAIHGQGVDRFTLHVRATHLAAVPPLAALFPLLLELEHEARRGRIGTPARDLARRRMARAPHRDHLVSSSRLLAPAR